MPEPRIAQGYGNRSQNDMRDFYGKLQGWIPEGGASWGPMTQGTNPPNPLEYGAVSGSKEEQEMLRLILAAMGNQGAFDNYIRNKSNMSTKDTSSDSMADKIIEKDLNRKK